MNGTLVSIVVLTYNSSNSIQETLNSILEQEYRNIEVIISDDFSKDDTIEICAEWLRVNSARFVRTKLLTTNTNTGTTANCNRGVNATHGKWIKLIAGDDKFLPDSIKSYVDYVTTHSDMDFVFSKVLPFGNTKQGKYVDFFKDTKKYFEKLTYKEFKIALCKKDFLPAASAFLKRDTLVRLGFFDEAIPFIEDWPLWIKGIFQNCKFGWLDKCLIGYRYSESSVSQNLKPIFVDSQNKAERHNLLYIKKISIFFWLREYINYKSKNNGCLMWKILRCFRYINPYSLVLFRISLKLSDK